MPRITVVEDDKMLAEIYKTSLEAAGFTVDVAYDGQAALVLIKQSQPDLVILDLMLPQVSGEEVLRQMRTSDWGKEIKVIIATNISEAEAPDLIRTLELQFERYLVKANTGPRELVEIIKETLLPPAPATS